MRHRIGSRGFAFQSAIDLHFRFREMTDEALLRIIASPITLPINEQAARDEMARRTRNIEATVVEPAAANDLAIIDVESSCD